ncbi:hypothetical protein DFQ29_003095, partial [Apophysomyces sp. BC1021]
MVLGDLNTRLDRLTGDSKRNERAKNFADWIGSKGLTLWNAELAYGIPTHFSVRGTSIIDFFLSRRANFLNVDLRIHEQHALGSDHHLCELSFEPVSSIPQLPVASATRKLWRLSRLKKQEVHEKYVSSFEAKTGMLRGEIQSAIQEDNVSPCPAQMESFVERLTTSIYEALDCSVGRAQPHPKCAKWFWNDHLQQLAERRQRLYQRWRRFSNHLER